MDARAKNSSDFNCIYEFAIKDNRPALTVLFNSNVYIDVRDHNGLLTPAALLAAEGNHEAVALLQSLGANNDFIAMGYASVGNTKMAGILRQEHGASIKYLAIGAAMHGNHEYAEELRIKYNLNPDWLIFGAAFAGHHDYVTALMSLQNARHKPGVPLPISELKLQEMAICAKVKGYVMGGFKKEVVQILDEFKESTSDLVLRVAINAAARTGNRQLVDELIIRQGYSPYLLDGYYQVAAEGAAEGGHIAYARELLDMASHVNRVSHVYRTRPRDEQIQAVIKSGMVHGHFHEILKHFSDLLKVDKNYFLENKISLSAFVKDYAALATLAASRGNLALAGEIFAQHGLSATDIIKAMDTSGLYYNHKLLIHALAFTNNAKFLDALCIAAITMNSDRKSADSVKSNWQGWNAIFENQCFTTFKQCHRVAVKINSLMAKYQFNFDQAEAFLESQELRNLLRWVTLSKLNASPIKLNSLPANVLLKISPSFGNLSVIDLDDMAEKLMLNIAKTFVDRELADYYTRNRLAYYQHTNRSTSLKKACAEVVMRPALKSLINSQQALFNGDIIFTTDPARPKHEQPLSNTGKDNDFYQTIEKMNKNPRLMN